MGIVHVNLEGFISFSAHDNQGCIMKSHSIEIDPTTFFFPHQTKLVKNYQARDKVLGPETPNAP